MIPLSKTTRVVESKDNIGVFEIDALYPGYGVTVGNSLRRVLLSSLAGAAITQVKIKGVTHELSTISGISEDVLTILLNLKQMRFKMFSDEPQTATLKVKGEKKVKGSDFDIPSQLELVSKDLHIATLTDKKAELNMEVIIEKGTGYVTSEKHKKGRGEIGAIFIDAIFTPIQRVSFKVQDMRVGEHTNYNRLTLEIETDGTISPEHALEQASEILVEQFKVVKEGVEGSSPVEKPVKKPATKKVVAKKTVKKTTKK